MSRDVYAAAPWWRRPVCWLIGHDYRIDDDTRRVWRAVHTWCARCGRPRLGNYEPRKEG